MLEDAFGLAMLAGVLAGAILGMFAIMRAARSWSQSREGAVARGVVLAAVLTVFLGSGWAEDKLPSCDRIVTTTAWDSRVSRQSAQQMYSECRAERSRIVASHEIAVLMLLTLAGAIGFRKSDYFHPMSLDRAVAIIDGTAEALERNDRNPYSSETFNEAVETVSKLPLDADYREHLKLGRFLVGINSNRGM